MKILLFGIAAIALLTGCSNSTKASSNVKDRWYTKAQVKAGEQVFKNNCAACHGTKAQSTPNWRTKLADGSYPPPPLNGTAHAWHHPMKALEYTVKNGGKAFGGKMPGFGNVLSQQQTKEAIAYFQHFWNDDIYNDWAKRSGLK